MDALPEEIERMKPDCSLYPGISDTAYGLLSDEQGRKKADLRDFWDGEKTVVLYDRNILACRSWKGLLRQLRESRARVEMHYGIDAGMLTEAKAKALSGVRLATIRFLWNRYQDRTKVMAGLRTFAEHYPGKLGHKAQVEIVCNLDTTPEEDLARVYTLSDMSFEPYVKIHDAHDAQPFYRSLQRWVNNRAIFHAVPDFAQYDARKTRE